MKKTIITGGLLIAVLLPLVSLAQGTGIWKNTSCAATSATGGPVDSCGFCDGLVVAQNIIVYLTEISATISVGVIIFGALEMMLGGGSESRVSGGRRKILNALIGFAITLAAWLIIGTILQMLSGGVNFPWNSIVCKT